MKKRKRFTIFMVLLLVISSLIACSTNDTPAEQNDVAESNESKKSDLKVALSVDPPSLDFHLTTAAVTRQIGWHIYETLFTYGEDYTIQPLLAEGYNISEDGRTTIVNIREGIKFHNGKEMTSEDVIASLERWSKLSNIADVVFSNVVSLNAKDDYTVEIVTEEPSSVLLPALTSPIEAAVIMPKEIVESAGEEEVTEYIGTGPFQFEDWRQGNFIKLTRFDDYQSLPDPANGLAGKREALIENLYFYFATDTASRVAGLQSGDYDFAEAIPIDNYETLKDDPNIELVIAKPDKMNFLFMNNKTGPFSNPKIREAVNAALDLDEIMSVAATNPEFYRINPGIMFEEQTAWYSDAGKDVQNQKDTEKAVRLLQEAGYNNEPITILASEEYEYLYDSALVVMDQLEEIGMNINLEVYDWPTLLERRADENAWDIFFTYTTLSPHPTLISYLDSRMDYPGWYHNSEVIELLDQLAITVDQEESKELFNEIQTIFYEDIPTIKLGDMHGLVAVRKNVKGFNYFYDVKFWNVYKEE